MLRFAVWCFTLPAGLALAQGQPAKSQEKAAQDKPSTTQVNPWSTCNKFACARVKDVLLKSAEKMPEENYAFKPVDSVRSYGQIVGHVADAQYLFCSQALREKIRRRTSSTSEHPERT